MLVSVRVSAGAPASVVLLKYWAVQALLSGWFSATDYMKRDPKDAARRMGIRQQTSGEQFLEAQRGLPRVRPVHGTRCCSRARSPRPSPSRPREASAAPLAARRRRSRTAAVPLRDASGEGSTVIEGRPCAPKTVWSPTSATG